MSTPSRGPVTDQALAAYQAAVGRATADSSGQAERRRQQLDMQAALTGRMGPQVQQIMQAALSGQFGAQAQAEALTALAG